MVLSVSDRLNHLGAPAGIVINPVEHRNSDAKLEKRDQDFFHSPKRWLIASLEGQVISTTF